MEQLKVILFGYFSVFVSPLIVVYVIVSSWFVVSPFSQFVVPGILNSLVFSPVSVSEYKVLLSPIFILVIVYVSVVLFFSTIR